MTGRRFRTMPSLLLALTLTVLGAPLLAQDVDDQARSADEAEVFAIEIEIVPGTTLSVPSGRLNDGQHSVWISGRTLRLGSRTVHLLARHDQGEAPDITATAVPEADGRFRLGITPAVEGDYTITVTAPDGKGQAVGKLRVIDAPDDVADDVAQALTAATERVDDTLIRLTTLLDNEIPVSPALDEAQQQLRQARAAFEPVKAAVGDAARAARDALAGIPPEYADDPEVTGRLGEITRTLEDLEQAHVEIARVMSTPADEACQGLVVAGETLKAIGLAMNLIGKLTSVVAGLGLDVLGKIAADANPAASSQSRFVAGELAKNVDVLTGFASPVSKAAGLMMDLAGHLIDRSFEKYCESFTGPIAASLVMRANENGEWYRSSHYRIDGQISLVYAKQAFGRTVKLSGHIQGFGHSFKTYERAMWVMAPALMRMSLVSARFDWPPLGSQASAHLAGDAADLWGSIAAAAVPNSFRIQVQGRFDGNDLLLELGDVVHDADPTHRFLAIVHVLAPAAMLVPQFVSYSMGYISPARVVRNATEGQVIRLPVRHQGATMIAEGRFADTRDGGIAQGRYELNLRACNPACR